MSEAKAALSNDSFAQDDLNGDSPSESEEQFRLVLEASPDGFIILKSVRDAAGAIANFDIAYANPAAARNVNCLPEKLIGQPLSHLFPNCRTNGIFDHYVTVAQTGKSQTFEAFHEGKDLTGWFRNVVVKLNNGIAVSFSDVTERKRAEEASKQAELALQQREQHFRVALQTAKLGSWEHDLVTGVLTCSAQCKANFGLPPDAEFTHETLFAALHPDDRSLVQAAIQRCLEERTDYEVEERCYHPDGSLHWLIVRGQLLYDSKGTPIRLVGVTFDITERKRAEIALQESQELFQRFMTYSPIAAFVKDETGRYLYANPWIERVFGQPQSELIGRTDFELLPPATAEQFHRNDMAVRTSDQPMQMIETVHQEDGEHSYMAFKFPLRDASGQQLLAGVAIDISERIQSEAVLQRYQLLSEHSRDIVLYLGKNGQILEANRAAEQAYSYTRTELLSLKIADLRASNTLPTLSQQFEQASREGILFETIHQRKDGSQFPVEVSAQSAVINGELVVLSTIRDITERKKAEVALSQSEERLRRLANAMPQIVWTSNADGKVTYVNQQWFDYAGLTLEQTQDPEQYLQVIHPDDVSQHYEQWLKASESGSLYQTEIRIRRASDGAYRWFLTRAVPVRTEQGQITGWYGTSTDIDDRKQTEAALRESEQRLQLAQQAGKIGAWEWNLLTNEVSWSDGIWPLLALEPNSITPNGESIARFIHPDDRAQVFQRVAAALAQGDDYSDEFRAIRQDGITCWIFSKGRVIRSDDGQPIRLVGTNIDITDRKQAEEALRNSAERLSVALAAAKLGDWDWNAATDIVTFSEQAAELFGIPPGPHMTWTEMQNLLHPDDREQARLQVEQSIAERSDYDIEYRVIHSDQTQRWIAAKGRAQYDSSGQILGMLGVVQDITARKQAEVEREQLLAREQLANQTLQRFIEHTPAAVAMLDRDMRYLLASQRWMQEYASGYTNISGLSHYEVAPDIPEHWRQVHQRCLAGATERCEEDCYAREDGSMIWLHWEILPWYVSVGEIGGIIIFAENITERKQAAQEREKLLAREQVAREEAEQANRIKDEFLAVLSHELRSPLNPILGWAKLLQTRRFDESGTKRALETIERNAKLQTQLIDDLLDVSRILRGKMMLNVSSVNLVTVVDAALETVQLSAEAKGIEVRKIVGSDIEPISGDPSRLQQVVWNLLSNAVKFTPNGGQIEIRLEQISTEAQIQVRDTGKGITPEFLPHVFEYFRQEDGTTTRKFGGLGLGLAIVRYLAELHGGTVKAESPGEGLGATFTLLLPISNNTNVENPNDAQLSSSVVEILPLTNLKILVVDDDIDMRELIFTILEQAGAKVELANSAIEVLETLEAFKPDILISDIGIPEIDGYELLRQIRRRSSEEGGQVPAIALTAYAGEMNQQQALAVGFQKHIAKPVEPEELIKAIASLAKSQ